MVQLVPVSTSNSRRHRRRLREFVTMHDNGYAYSTNNESAYQVKCIMILDSICSSGRIKGFYRLIRLHFRDDNFCKPSQPLKLVPSSCYSSREQKSSATSTLPHPDPRTFSSPVQWPLPDVVPDLSYGHLRRRGHSRQGPPVSWPVVSVPSLLSNLTRPCRSSRRWSAVEGLYVLWTSSGIGPW